MVLKILFALMSLTAWAKDKTKVHVMIVDKHVKPESFTNDSYSKSYTQFGAEGKASLPPVNVLENLFNRCEIADEIADWDQMSKDIYALTAKTLSLKELHAEYPQIPLAKSKLFQSELLKIMKLK